jgi:hypothetical protein
MLNKITPFGTPSGQLFDLFLEKLPVDNLNVYRSGKCVKIEKVRKISSMS